jgi:Cys-tRNA(Pro) deacylase
MPKARPHVSETPATQMLRDHGVPFSEHLYDYVEHGGTAVSASALGVDEHAVVKTLVMEDERAAPLLVLMHGDREVSTKNLARYLGVKSVEPASSERVTKLTGYQVGGTSPFGTWTRLPVYAERTIFNLDRICINGGKRGFLVEIDPAVLRSIDAGEVEVGI